MAKALGSLALMRAAAKTAEITAAGDRAAPLAESVDSDHHESRRVRRDAPVERDAGATDPAPDGTITAFLDRHFLHYNAGTARAAAEAWKQHVDDGGAVVLTLAGAMSTAQLGRSIAPMIRAGKIHAISTTGANLEEDVMNLIGRTRYEELPDYSQFSPEDDEAIYDAGKNRVTDTAIPDAVMVPLANAMLKEWRRADKAGERYFPHEVLYKILRRETLASQYVVDPDESWLIAAMEANLPIVVPGWEDSTLGNSYCAALLKGQIENAATVRSGMEYMADLAAWYARTAEQRAIGCFQIGGGIAGDFWICVIPMLHEELKRDDLRKLSFFAQVTDAHVSYGGYSGAAPAEKITWGKIDSETETFDIHSDATIVFPLVAAIVMGW